MNLGRRTRLVQHKLFVLLCSRIKSWSVVYNSSCKLCVNLLGELGGLQFISSFSSLAQWKHLKGAYALLFCTYEQCMNVQSISHNCDRAALLATSSILFFALCHPLFTLHGSNVGQCMWRMVARCAPCTHSESDSESRKTCFLFWT